MIHRANSSLPVSTRALLPIACFIFGSLTVSCRTPATQIQLFIDTDAPVQRPMTLEILSFAGAIAPVDLAMRANLATMGILRLVRMNNATDTFTAGGSIGVLPPADRTSNGVTVWIRASFAATPSSPAVLIDRAARVSFVRGRSGTARVFLPLRCGDSSVVCLGCSRSVYGECPMPRAKRDVWRSGRVRSA